MEWMTCLGWKFPCTIYSNWHPMPFTSWSFMRGVAISSGMDPWGSSSTWTESLCLSGNSTSVATLGHMKSKFRIGEGERCHGTPKITFSVGKTTLFPVDRYDSGKIQLRYDSDPKIQALTALFLRKWEKYWGISDVKINLLNFFL